MKLQNILSAIAITSILFIGCSKETTVEPRDVNNGTKIYEFSPKERKGISGDDNDGIVRINSRVERANTGEAVANAEVRLSNSTYDIVAITNANGEVEIDLPEEGIYFYTVSENGLVKVVDQLVLFPGVFSRVDILEEIIIPIP